MTSPARSAASWWSDPQHAQLAAYRHRLDIHFIAACDTLRTHDPSIAEALEADTISLTNELDLAIDLLVIAGGDAAAQTTTALAYHHLSRVASHVTNIATAIASPLDQLDTYEGCDDLRSARDVDAGI